MREGVSFSVSESDRERLCQAVADRNTPQKYVYRAQIILLSDEGRGTEEIMARLGKNKSTVWRWQQRFMEEGVEGLFRDKTRPPGKPRTPDEKRKEIVDLTLGPAPEGTTHWTLDAMAEASGVSRSTVRVVWQENGLAPHRFRQFKLSGDSEFYTKMKAVVGLYMNPPQNAVVFAVDEKAQIQALDRTQPGLPMKRGRAQTMTHDYKRNGVATLFAALNVLTGEVIGRTDRRHRHIEFLRFLKELERRVPPDKEVHVILDNYATHKHAKVREWLARHPRWTFHFTPTSCPWLNAVEGVFAQLSRRCLRRGVFRCVDELTAAIHAYLVMHNRHCKPFIWVAAPEAIMASFRRGHQKLAEQRLRAQADSSVAN